ncbi:unnamed protein product [Lupinus luteus]|uniref:Strictosidine synthase conserved region domain-containing protein n=1 Tax=Lupinus luteus TaxID=3873 RepID=A0AAV1Y3E0_LUPLU
MGSNGGPPTQLVGTKQDIPLKFVATLDIDLDTTAITMIDKRDSFGSLFKYDPSTNQTTVLLRGLEVASVVVVSRDDSFVLVSELVANIVWRFWLKGPRT